MLLTNILPYKRYSLFLSSLVGPQEFSVPLPYTVITRPEFASRPCGSGKRDAKNQTFYVHYNVLVIAFQRFG